MKREKQNKKNNEQSSLEMAIKICEINPKRRGRLWWEGFMEKVSFESGSVAHEQTNEWTKKQQARIQQTKCNR